MKINVHIIAPYESMLLIIKECVPLFPHLNIQYSVGDLRQGADIAATAEKQGADIIISRGGTAQLIKQSVTVPVIDMQVSGYDMIRSLMLASNLTDKTAIVGFSNITSGAQAIIDLLDLPIKVFTIQHSDEAAPLILELRSLDYRQIVGDVITINTTIAYGMKGFLIQSGKESIIKSLEDASLIYGYLHNRNDLSLIMESYILKDKRNLAIYDDDNNKIYEHLTDFAASPLTEDQLSVLNHELHADANEIIRNYPADNAIIDVNGSVCDIRQKRYKIYAFEKNEIRLFGQKGVTAHTDIEAEPLAAASRSISVILDHISSLYHRNEPIWLQGDKGSGKDFVTKYIHQQLSPEGILLTIDFSQFNIHHLSKIPLTNVSTIRLLHIDSVQELEKLTAFMKDCRNQGIRLFVITEGQAANDRLQPHKISKIMMPVLAERLDDIQPLTQYFLSYYHQQYGTTAVKIKDDALHALEQNASHMNIDDLKNLIKQSALNEKEYVIGLKTIEKVLSIQQTKPFNQLPKGTLKDIEKEVIKMVLLEENNNQSRAAERLGINRATLWRKLKE